ncbi:hypothetical protein ACP70R_026427 [Stipagrostis hirtigluma subsp. patula]
MEDYYCFPNSLETAGYIDPRPRNHSAPSPRPRRSSRGDEDAGEPHRHHHYLDACFGCGRLLGRNRDIFMYRGDTPFCSEECRQHQIEADEAREKRPRQPAAARSEQQRQSSSPRRRISVWAR